VPLFISTLALVLASVPALGHSIAFASRSHLEAGDGMAQITPRVGVPEASRQTLRLTIRSSANGFELISVERLQMITPPQPGERPEAGRHGGNWFELRDGENRVLAHRVIDPSLFNSVELHSPDGKIRREFGALRETVFEVLLPDMPGAQFAVAMGDPLTPQKPGDKAAVRSGELARFDLSQSLKERKQ
jgi:hypothetical protein